MDFDTGMHFVSGADKSHFTKTPANVPADHWDSPPPPKAVRGRGGKGSKAKGKRKLGAAVDGSDDEPEIKKLKKVPGGTKLSKAAAATLDRPKQKRKAKKKAAQIRPIPRSYDECDEADRLLLELRDANGDWKDIRPKWQELTGEKTAPSTLPNRYARIKNNLTVIEEDDNKRLLDAKKKVEEGFDVNKWDLIANMVLAEGGKEYLGVVLKRQYKKLMTSVGTVPPEGIVDNDFLIPELESGDERIGKAEKVEPGKAEDGDWNAEDENEDEDGMEE